MSLHRKPLVAIVGRPNVGKSAIFNRLANRRIAIVHDEPGVTRDRLTTEVTKVRVPYELVDTGGIGSIIEDGFAAQVRTEADIAIAAADLILFVVDAREGVHPIDHELAAVLRRAHTPVILLVNKVDTAKTDADAAEFAILGFAEEISVSAAHGRNFELLTRRIAESLSERGLGGPGESRSEKADHEDEPEPVKIAIVGRPNVGKSSLINAILNDARSIVSDVAGTTRDAIDVPYEREGQHYLLIDTAGIRQRTKRDTSVEVFSVMRSEKSIRRADICLLVIDALSGVVSQDRRIAKMIIDENKPCIVLLNKFDLFHPEASYQDRIEHFKEDLGDDLFFIPYAPKVAISAKHRQHLGKIFGAIDTVVETSRKPVSTGALNRLLQQSIERNPPPVRNNKRLKLLYATQKREDSPGVVPVPEYLLFVNHADLLTRTYERFLENQIRKEYPMEGLPFVFRLNSRIDRHDLASDGETVLKKKTPNKKKASPPPQRPNKPIAKRLPRVRQKPQGGAKGGKS